MAHDSADRTAKAGGKVEPNRRVTSTPPPTFRKETPRAADSRAPREIERAVEKAAAALDLSLRYDLGAEPLSGLSLSVHRLRPDIGTLEYLERARQARHGVLLTWLHHRLRTFLSDFDINGYLGTYPLFVLSTEQWRTLLPEGFAANHLLDIGAGRGDVTAEIGRLFSAVTTVETSRGMARRLARLGYRVLEMDLGRAELDEQFDAVSLLNVLDRCDRPLSLLGQARQLLRPGGLLIVALVLPYRPFVYEGRSSRAPSERLPITGASFEAAAREFVTLALLPLGLRVHAVSRAPYLSGGDASRPLYELDDLIVVAEAVGPPPPILGRRAPAT